MAEFIAKSAIFRDTSLTIVPTHKDDAG